MDDFALGVMAAFITVGIIFGIATLVAQMVAWLRSPKVGATTGPGVVIITTKRGTNERERVVMELRELCADFGTNDWEPTDDLAHVINKCLGTPLYESRRETEQGA